MMATQLSTQRSLMITSSPGFNCCGGTQHTGFYNLDSSLQLSFCGLFVFMLLLDMYVLQQWLTQQCNRLKSEKIVQFQEALKGLNVTFQSISCLALKRLRVKIIFQKKTLFSKQICCNTFQFQITVARVSLLKNNYIFSPGLKNGKN